jgi:hypothetical protein
VWLGVASCENTRLESYATKTQLCIAWTKSGSYFAGVTKQEAKALPILLRHSPGMMQPNRTYILAEDAVQKLRDAGIGFQEITSDEEILKMIEKRILDLESQGKAIE